MRYQKQQSKQIRPSLNFISNGEKKEIILSKAKAEFNLKLKNQYIEVNSFKLNINKLIYLEKSKPF